MSYVDETFGEKGMHFGYGNKTIFEKGLKGGGGGMT